MKRFSLIGMLTLMLVSMPIFSCNVYGAHIDNMPRRGLVSGALQYMRDHAVCITIIGALCGYIYVNSVLESMKPDPYEGPLKEAHFQIYELEKQIEELNKAITFFSPLYKVFAPKLKSLTSIS